MSDGIQMFSALSQQFAERYGVSNMEYPAQLSPDLQTQLLAAVTEHSTLLRRINTDVVRDLKGRKLYMGTSRPIARRTQTDNNDPSKRRVTASPWSMAESHYELAAVQHDVHIHRDLLNQWAAYGQSAFAARYMAMHRKSIADAVVLMGWHGTRVATDSDPDANPLFEDMAVGWLQQIRDGAPSQYMGAGVKVGPDGDYANLPHLLAEARLMIPKHLRGDDLVAIVGDSLVAYHQGRIVELYGEQPSEAGAVKTTGANGQYLPMRSEAFFPESSVLITSMKNLSWYVQRGSTVRVQRYEPSNKRVEDWTEHNQGFVVEDLERVALIEGIQLPDGQGGWETPETQVLWHGSPLDGSTEAQG